MISISRRTERTAQQLSHRFSTNFDLIVELLDLVGKDETIEILQMRPSDLISTARVNLLKNTRSELIEKLKGENISAKPIPNIPEGIEVYRRFEKLGSSLAYLSGEVYPQGLGSMLTVEALDPQPDEFIIDMAASPGGKSSFIAERMKGSGRLLVNDVSTKRMRSLIFNLTRHGFENVEFSNLDAKKLDAFEVDRILLDAPCTGGGLIVSKPHRRISKDLSDSIQLQKLQIQLLRKALLLLKQGGICLYSTCAISPLENEMVINHVKNKVKFENLDIQGTTSYLGDTKIGKRLYPNKDRCDGFFIVKMVKL